MKRKTTVIINGKRNHNVKRRLIISTILMIILIVILSYIISTIRINQKFADDVNEFYKLNSKTIFSIDKMYMYSSANAIENKETRPVWNLNLYQYTDIAIYINNRSKDKLDYENSIKEIYIDNIKYGEVKKGEQSLFFKDVREFGKSIFSDVELEEGVENINTNEYVVKNVENKKIKDKLEYQVLNDGDADYSKPQIYADCSNPITLEYVNNNIKTNEILSDITSDVKYDGNLLRKCGVILSDIECTITFNITIINFYNQKFVANVYVEIPLEDTITGETIYDGKFVKRLENTNLIRFFRVEQMENNMTIKQALEMAKKENIDLIDSKTLLK